MWDGIRIFFLLIRHPTGKNERTKERRPTTTRNITYNFFYLPSKRDAKLRKCYFIYSLHLTFCVFPSSSILEGKTSVTDTQTYTLEKSVRGKKRSRRSRFLNVYNDYFIMFFNPFLFLLTVVSLSYLLTARFCRCDEMGRKIKFIWDMFAI